MTNPATPRRPAGLSGQEEEDLRALEKGYDTEAGALPDPDPHDDPTRKPGDDAMSVSGAEAGSSGGAAVSGMPPRQPDEESQPEGPARSRPLGDAERRGLLPSRSVATPPTDRPDDTASEPTNLDPNPALRRP